jgi:hypothetical protein
VGKTGILKKNLFVWDYSIYMERGRGTSGWRNVRTVGMSAGKTANLETLGLPVPAQSAEINGSDGKLDSRVSFNVLGLRSVI